MRDKEPHNEPLIGFFGGSLNGNRPSNVMMKDEGRNGEEAGGDKEDASKDTDMDVDDGTEEEKDLEVIDDVSFFLLCVVVVGVHFVRDRCFEFRVFFCPNQTKRMVFVVVGGASGRQKVNRSEAPFQVRVVVGVQRVLEKPWNS